MIREYIKKKKDEITPSIGIEALKLLGPVLLGILSLAEWIYRVGRYYYGYSVPISFISRAFFETGSVGQIIYLVIFTAFLSAYTFVGISCYRKCNLSSFFVGAVMAVCAIFVLPGVWVCIKTGAPVFSRDLLQIVYMAVFLTAMISIVVIIFCIVPEVCAQLERNQNLLQQIEKKQNSGKSKGLFWSIQERRKQKIMEKITELEKKAKEKYGDDIPVRQEAAWQKACVVFSITLATVLLIVNIFGLTNSLQQQKYATIVNPEESYSEILDAASQENRCNQMVVLYQDQDYVILAPGYQDGVSLSIYTDYQRVVSLDEVSLHYDTYDTVKIL